MYHFAVFSESVTPDEDVVQVDSYFAFSNEISKDSVH